MVGRRKRRTVLRLKEQKAEGNLVSPVYLYLFHSAFTYYTSGIGDLCLDFMATIEGPAGEFSVRSGEQREGVKERSIPFNKNNNLLEAKSDTELLSYLREAKLKKRPVVVTYGAAWCHACSKMLPTFFNLSNEYSNPLFVYADVDKCAKATEDVKYTPTFRFFRDGDKVDEFYGAGPQRLRDRVWLQS